MKITLSKFAGFCDGVRRAYEIVASLDMEKTKKPVFVLGSLVHNDDVVKKIEEKGIGKISREDFFSSKKGEIGTIIITAHGDDPGTFEKAKENGIEIVDTTCPNVIKVQRLARVFAKRGVQVVLVGDKDHKEVRSIYEWGNKVPVVVSSEEETKNLNLDKNKKIIIISQTTQNKEKVEKIFSILKGDFFDVELINTVCLATENRQEEMRHLASSHDAVVVIGGAESANSRRLFEIARAINENSFFVENASQIESGQLLGKENVLISAGASSPDWVIEEVVDKIGSFEY